MVNERGPEAHSGGSYLDRRATPKLPPGAVTFGLPGGADAPPDPPANGWSMAVKSHGPMENIFVFASGQ